MSRYQFQAMDTSGRSRRGVMEADNPADLEKRLARMRSDLIHYKELKPRSAAFAAKSVSRRDLIGFCFQLQQLVAAGVPMLESLNDMRDGTANPRMQQIINDLIENIEGGNQLSQALEKYPGLFDEVFVNLVKAGEKSGQLGEVLLHLTESLKWQDELASATKTILMYPMIVGPLVIGIVYFLMTWLVPQMVPFIEELGGVLPWYTEMLINVSDAFSAYGLYIIGLLTALFFAVKILSNISLKFRYQMHKIQLKLPLIGKILENIKLSRFSSALSMLYVSGITVLDAIRLCEKIIGNMRLEEALQNIHQMIAEGEQIDEAFVNVGIFPPLVISMVRIGKQTGELDKSLANVSYFFDREVDESISQFKATIPIILTVVLGGLIGMVMFAILGPMYDTIASISG